METGTFAFQIDGVSSPISVARFDGEEAISELFQYHLWLTSSDPALSCEDVVGKTAVLTLSSESTPRHVHGIVSRFSQGEEGKKLTVYRATLVPKAWRLLHRHDARIFQELGVADIIEKVLKGAGLTGDDYRISLQADHPTREYCVQYRESDWAFLSRLMEEEGIFYQFEHDADKHVLVIGDGPQVHAAIDAPATIAYRQPLGAMAHSESVSRFTYTEEIRPGKVTLNDFNFKKPAVAMAASAAGSVDSDLEVYDYPGDYEVPDGGSQLAKIRLEEWQSLRKVAHGASGCARLTAGYRFTLSEHSHDAHNREYLVTRLHRRGVQQQMGEGGGDRGEAYASDFHAVPADVPFRPLRRTPRPTVNGVQTAVVVGPDGEEIYTDEHGRVKVHFPWDRLGNKDEKSSCWIRVSQSWAGPGWGAMSIPRVGHEVIVDFVEGDPDRPIIVGRVYHGTNKPPYTLPDDMTKSTWKSCTSTGGDGYNEIRFEDKKDKEELFIHAQKDWTISVEHDKTETVGKDEKVTIDGNADRSVSGDQSEAISGDRNITVDGDHAESISGDMSIAVDGDKDEEVSKNSKEKVTKDKTVTVSGAYKLSVDDTITIKCGDGKVTVEKDGTVTIKGKDITLKGDGTIKLQGQKLELKADSTVQIEASGAAKLKGSGVDIN